MFYAAIDPGKQGGLAYTDADQRIHAIPLPGYDKYPDANHATALTDTLRKIHTQTEPVWLVENVGFHVAGNAAPSSVKLARQVGILLGILATLNAETQLVYPQSWMRRIPDLPTGKSNTRARKKHILAYTLEHTPETYASHPSTLAARLRISDAVAMLLTKQ